MTITQAERDWLDALWAQALRDAEHVQRTAAIMLGLKPPPPAPTP